MISIYNYNSAQNYLNDYFNFKKDTDSEFSLSKWSKLVGLKSPRPIVEIIKKEKKLKTSFASSIVDKIGLDASEYTYFLALVAKENSEDENLKKMYECLLLDLHPSPEQEFNDKRFEDNDLFSHWILTTILGATKLKNIDLTAQNLKTILREEISEEIIDAGIKFLVEQKLLTLEKGKLTKVYDRVSTITDKKHSNVNNYFQQMADLAKKAVNVPLTEREFQSFNLPIVKDKIPLAKEIIRNCRNSLTALSSGEADEVYQMNMFLFPLTQTEKPSKDTMPESYRKKA